jgi:hypothetical protein
MSSASRSDETYDQQDGDSANAEEQGANLASALNGGGEESEFSVPSTDQGAGRNGLLMLVGLIAIGAGIVFVMHKKAGPAEAVASPETQQAQQTITKFLSGSNDNIKAMQTLLRDTEKVVNQFLAYPSMTQVPLEDLRTNPFRHQLARKPDGTNVTVDEAAAKRKREEERQRMLAAVQQLQLTSILHGQKRACMVNNTLYVEGQTVDGFTIEKINPSSVIVKNGAYRFELQMQK